MEAEIEMGGQKTIAVIEDLSSSGCCVSYIAEKTESDPEIGDDLKVFCPYFTENNGKFIPCKVQRTTKDSKKITLGVTYDKPSPEILIKIQDYVTTILHHT